MQINWDTFKANNHDARGVRYKFEDLCRQLFANENLSGNKLFRYLHANPNNYGIETEPIYDEVNKRWIGFQAKFFDNKVEYGKIRESAEKIVTYYTGNIGHVDLVYLFCNKPITATADDYIQIINLLNKYGIDLQLITDTAILDLVINKYPYIGQYYFGNHTIADSWFNTQAEHAFNSLGERYNKDLNVITKSFNDLSLFVHDQRAVTYLNEKKERLLNEIDKLNKERLTFKAYLQSLRNAVLTLPDVDVKSLHIATQWTETLKNSMKFEIAELVEKKKEYEQRKKAYSAFGDNAIGDGKDAAIERHTKLGRLVEDIKTLINLPKMVAIEDEENRLLYGRIMILHGEAGTGKSHLLATKTQSLLDEKRPALLLLAGNYHSNNTIQEQITKNLDLDFGFKELIDVLETIGEKNNCIVPVFIDAINETGINSLWKEGLPLIIDSIKEKEMVRLIITYREGYEKLVLPDLSGEKGVINIDHHGFKANSIDAAREFLNHYDIPFSLLEYFGYEVSNPLFLSLYCKNYDGQEVSLPILYERLIERANKNIYRANKERLNYLGYLENDNILRPLIGQIADYFIEHNKNDISKSELLQLSYWAEYGMIPASYENYLVKEHILHSSKPKKSESNEPERFYFAFDQMNDYYRAKSIVDKGKSKEEIRQYLANEVLGIKDSVLENSWNIDLFINACVLYAEKYDEECIDIIDGLKKADDNTRVVFSKYIEAFQWRNTNGIKVDNFCEIIQEYPYTSDDLWQMLIGNSVKVSHPFNADFLHKYLLQYELNQRDYIWTVYINKLTLNDSDRIVQLVKMYVSGEKLEVTNEKQIELLLTLFGWILTSSNRWLRDYTSKAMVEILKEHFKLCKPLLEKFSDVNDPYVLQRLYGVVFGACCKRKNESLCELAEYVYQTVFCQERVYPDILLRDYARLIIEKYLVEKSGYHGLIDRKRIIPPYQSDPIPDIEYKYYEDNDYKGATLKVIKSMRVDRMGGYGDFGRYIFQSALHSFDVDVKKMFNYAVYHILTELGFNEEYFGDYDQNCKSYNRLSAVMVERIGKKYQWITLYNMLARISDNCKMVDHLSCSTKDDIKFKGAWNPFVRDFDPTYNVNHMKCGDVPKFKILEEYVKNAGNENKSVDISSIEGRKVWLQSKGTFLGHLKNTLILTDYSGQTWICLTKYCDTGRKDLEVEKLVVRSWQYAYFMTPEQVDLFKRCAEKGLSVFGDEVASRNEVHTVFNREFPWSPSCREIEKNAWVDACVNTGELDTISDIVEDSSFNGYEEFLCIYDENFDEKVLFEELDYLECMNPSDVVLRKENHQQEVYKEIGKILHSTIEFVWSTEYDVSKEGAISRSFPCGKLIDIMGLKQLDDDGFFYDKHNKLAAFDTNMTHKAKGVVVRKDILDGFLMQTGMKLVWLVDAAKEIHGEDYMIENRSQWEAVLVYTGENVDGEIDMIRNKETKYEK